jgi:uncharacterized protein (TIGR03437 family)
MLRTHLLRAAYLAAAGLVLTMASPAQQLPGNSTIKGTYNLRYFGTDSTVSDRPVSFAGTITFDGTANSNGYGGFTVTGTGAYQGVSSLKYLTSGQYQVLSNGLFFMTNPFDPANVTTFSNATTTVLYGGVGANGVVLASSTDTTFCDLFVAIPAATSASTATLNGTYYVGSMGFYSGDTSQTNDTFFQMTADGKGGLGNVTINGTSQNLSSANSSQTSNGATYTIGNANGTGTITFPAPSGVSASSVMLSGAKTLYVSQDGNFFVAGDPNNFDMIVGIKAANGSVNSSLPGLYFESMFQNVAVGDPDVDGIYGIQGAYNVIQSGAETGHQRTNVDGFGSFDYTFDDTFAPAADGTATFSGAKYAFGGGGNFILGTGLQGNYFLDVYVKAPVLSGSGVFLNPQGIVNAANSVPFTAGVAPGEVISLYGTNLASSTATTPGLPFPTTLGGASVTINGTPAPLYYASPTLLSVVVPYSEPSDGSFLNIQVTNNGQQSNVATVYSTASQPGIFTVPSGGIGNGAILDTNFKLINSSNPASVGQTIQIYLTGLGAVSPAVKEGSAGPSNPLSYAATPDVYIDDSAGNSVQARVLFAGLAPTLGGLYQLNITIPAGVASGLATIEIVGYDTFGDAVSDNYQATIPIK